MPTDHCPARLSELDLEIVRAIPPGGNWHDVPLNTPSRRLAQIRESAARGEGSRSTYYGRLRWDEPSYTISTYFNRPGNGCTIHPEADRMLTVREAARLQTFPDSLLFRGPARARHEQVGNAVPPLLAAQIASSFPSASAVDLFAGAGGLSLGLELAGHEVVAAVDDDDHALATLEGAHPGGVVEAADLSDPRERRRVVELVQRRLGGEPLDLLAGGPPCQGFSTAGWCAPEDARNELLGAFVDVALRLRPRALMMENVTALLWRGRALLDLALERLAAAGYDCRVGILHAEAYGVPQRRRRTLVIASLAGAPSWPVPAWQTAEPAYRRLQPLEADQGAPAPHTVRDAIGDLPSVTAESLDGEAAYASEPRTPLQAFARGRIGIKELLAQERPTVALAA